MTELKNVTGWVACCGVCGRSGTWRVSLDGDVNAQGQRAAQKDGWRVPPVMSGEDVLCPDHNGDAARDTALRLPLAVLVTIGNSDDKLSQAEWAEFQRQVDRLVRIAASEVYGRFHSMPDAPWQTAAWSFAVKDGLTAADEVRRGWLRAELTALGGKYGQDSVAWTEGPTDFLKVES